MPSTHSPETTAHYGETKVTAAHFERLFLIGKPDAVIFPRIQCSSSPECRTVLLPITQVSVLEVPSSFASAETVSGKPRWNHRCDEVSFLGSEYRNLNAAAVCLRLSWGGLPNKDFGVQMQLNWDDDYYDIFRALLRGAWCDSTACED
jgi:hypothetical protein